MKGQAEAERVADILQDTCSENTVEPPKDEEATVWPMPTVVSREDANGNTQTYELTEQVFDCGTGPNPDDAQAAAASEVLSSVYASASDDIESDLDLLDYICQSPASDLSPLDDHDFDTSRAQSPPPIFDLDVELTAEDFLDVGLYDSTSVVLPAPVHTLGWSAIRNHAHTINWRLSHLVLPEPEIYRLLHQRAAHPPHAIDPQREYAHTVHDMQLAAGRFVDAYGALSDKTGHSNMWQPMLVWEPLLLPPSSAARTVAYYVLPEHRMAACPTAPWTPRDGLAMRLFTSPAHTTAPLHVHAWGHETRAFECDRSRIARLDRDMGFLEEYIDHSDVGFGLLVQRFYAAVAVGVALRPVVSEEMRRGGSWACFDAGGCARPLGEWMRRYRELQELRMAWLRVQLRRVPALMEWLETESAMAQVLRGVFYGEVDVEHRGRTSVWWMPLMAMVGVAATGMGQRRAYAMYCYLAARLNTL